MFFFWLKIMGHERSETGQDNEGNNEHQGEHCMGSRLGHDKVKRMNIHLWSASPISCKRKLKLPIFFFKSTQWSQISWMRRVKSSLSCSGSEPGRLPGYSQSKSSPSKSNLKRPILTIWNSYPDFDIWNPLIKSLPVQHMDTTVNKDLPLGRVQRHLNKVKDPFDVYLDVRKYENHLRPHSWSRVPSTDGQQSLEFRVLLLQIIEPGAQQVDVLSLALIYSLTLHCYVPPVTIPVAVGFVTALIRRSQVEPLQGIHINIKWSNDMWDHGS